MFLACLVMGGVVMANLGLLTVLRRSREIAIRRVEGATRRDVALQFLTEGVALTAVGAVVGVGLGMVLAALRVSLEPVTGFAWTLPVREALVAVGVALGIGALASLLPAVRAARQEPVEGLVDD
jgi:putative ABC transport system permease protein